MQTTPREPARAVPRRVRRGSSEQCVLKRRLRRAAAPERRKPSDVEDQSRVRPAVGTVHRLRGRFGVDLDRAARRDLGWDRGNRITVHLKTKNRLGPVLVTHARGEADYFAARGGVARFGRERNPTGEVAGVHRTRGFPSYRRTGTPLERRNRHRSLHLNPPCQGLASRHHRSRMSDHETMLWLITLVPLFLVFEIWQLVLCERYLGVRQMATGQDPRTLPMGERLAFTWTLLLFLYWVWMGLLLGGSVGRLQALALFLISLGGFLLRRNSPVRWVLHILTFEGALRIGMLVSLAGVFWRRVH